MKWQWVAVEQVEYQEVVDQVVLTEKVKRHIQVAEAVTLDQVDTRDRAEVAEEPL